MQGKRKYFLVPFSFVVFGAGLIVGQLSPIARNAEAQSTDRVFELRTYTTHPGRLAELHARFADHTTKLFGRHGITNIGYFTPQDSPDAENTLVYMIAHDSREAAVANWENFRADPDWVRASEESRRNGLLVSNVESVFLNPTGYSEIK